MTRTPARLRLRRRLLLGSGAPVIAAVLVAAKLISVVVVGNWAVGAFARGDGNALRADAGVLGVANALEPERAPFAAGLAAVLDGRLEEAERDFAAALARTDPTRSCPARVNLELVRETQGDRAGAAGDRTRAAERYASASSVVDAAPPACFVGNTDPDRQRRDIRQDTPNRLAAKRTALNDQPPPAHPPPPAQPPPPPAMPPPPPAAAAPEDRDIAPRRLDPVGGDPLDKLRQLLQDAASVAPPGDSG